MLEEAGCKPQAISVICSLDQERKPHYIQFESALGRHLRKQQIPQLAFLKGPSASALVHNISLYYQFSDAAFHEHQWHMDMISPFCFLQNCLSLTA